MARVFLSHSSLDSRAAMAVKKWLIEQERGLADEIFLDLDPHTGIRPGERWKQALKQASSRCEVVICLLSAGWEASNECATEFRYAETLNKTIICGRLEPLPDTGITSEWQRCDLFAPDSQFTEIRVDAGEPVRLATEGLHRLLEALRALGIGAEFFPWPPPDDPDRAPYRGWAPLEEVDAAVFFGRDAQIVRGLDELRRMRTSGVESMCVILGPSGSGKSSFLRAGLLPRLRRDDRDFVPLNVVRPERAVLSGDLGLARSIERLRADLGFREPVLGEIKQACHPDHVEQLRAWLEQARQAARDRLIDLPADQVAPTLVLPLDQAEELFNADAGPESPRFLEILSGLLGPAAGITPGLIVTVTIRADRYEPLQVASQLTEVRSVVFDELKPMPAAQFTEVITGPARRASAAGRRLLIEPALVDRLIDDCAEGADALPLLALTLSRLYEDYASGGELTLAHYEAIGGMGRVVQNEVDAILAADPSERATQLEVLRAAFIPWLATINPENDQPMRRLARYNDLPEAGRPLIDKFIAKRLLVRDARDGLVVVEVALESLLRQWRELAAWLRAQAQDLKDADALERAAADWQASRHDPAWLLEGTRLTEAESLTTKPGFRDRLDPTRTYLEASRARENNRIDAERRHQQAELEAARKLAATEAAAKKQAQQHAAILRQRARILRTILAITVIVAMAAVAGFVWALIEQSQANTRTKEATAQKLIAEAQAMLANRPGGDVRAMKELLAANTLAPGSAEAALTDAAMKRRSVRKILETPSASDRAIPVQSIAISSDGSRIASGSNDSSVRLWDADSGAQLKKLEVGDRFPAWSVAFSPDGKWLATGSGQRTLQIWDAKTGEKIGAPMKHTEAVHSLAFSGDSRRVVTGSDDGAVRVWDIVTGKEISTPAAPLPTPTLVVWSVAFDRGSDLIASGSDDGFIRIWEANSGRRIAEAPTGSRVLSVTFSPAGDRLIAGGKGGIQAYDSRTLQPLDEAFGARSGTVTSVAFSPDATRIVSGSSADTVTVWDAKNRQQIGDSLTGHQGNVTSVTFSPRGERIISGSEDGTVREWNLAAALPIIGGQGPIHAVTFSNDGRRIVSGGDDGTLRLWEARTVEQIGQPLGDSLSGGEKAVTSIALGPNSSRVVSGGKDGSVRLWDLETRRDIVLPKNDPARQLSPDKTYLAGDPRAVTSVAFSSDGSRIASAGNDGAVRLWDAQSLAAIGVIVADYPIFSVAFSPDGHQIVTGSGGFDGSIQLWDVATLRAYRAPMQVKGFQIGSVDFDPKGQRIVAGAYDGSVRVWDLDNGRQVAQMSADRNPLLSVALSRNGLWIAAASNDRVLRLWDARTRKPLGGPLEGHQGPVMSVAFSPDDAWILSGGADGNMLLWPASKNFADLVCGMLNRNISPKQWKQWVEQGIPYENACPRLPVPADE